LRVTKKGKKAPRPRHCPKPTRARRWKQECQLSMGNLPRLSGRSNRVLRPLFAPKKNNVEKKSKTLLIFPNFFLPPLGGGEGGGVSPPKKKQPWDFPGGGAERNVVIVMGWGGRGAWAGGVGVTGLSQTLPRRGRFFGFLFGARGDWGANRTRPADIK